MKKLLIIGVVSTAASLHADTAYLQSSGSNNASAASDASCWSPAIAPNSTDGATTDFVVQDGLIYRNAATSFSGKSIQLGASDFSSAGNFHNDYNGYTTVNDIRLYRGQWTYLNNRSQQLKGTATVNSTAEDPYVFNFTGTQDSQLLNFTFVGDETSAFKVTTWYGSYYGTPNKPVTVLANQSGTYSGSWIIGRGVLLYAYTSTWNNGGNNTTSAMVFGKPLATLNPKALVMESGSMLRYEVGSPRTFAASDNRGLWLDARNGNVKYWLTNNFKHDFCWPIGGEGTLQLTGTGVFNLKAPCAVTLSADDTLELVLCSGSSIASTGGLILPENYTLALESTTTQVTVSNLTATNAVVKFPVAADGSACAQLRLSGNINVTGQIGIVFSTVPTVSATNDIPVIVIDSSVSREFTADDFSPYSVAGAQCPNAIGVKVTRDTETGDQIVSVTVVPYIKTRVPAGSTNWGYFEAWAWGDGSSVTPAVNDGNVYMTWDTYLGDRGEGTSLVVPGESLVLYNPTRSGYGMYLRHRTTTFKHLLALDNTMLWAYSYGTGNQPTKGQLHEVAGSLEVQTTAGNAFELIAARSQIMVSAAISGDGTIRARSTPDVYSPPSKVEITAENLGYKGYLHAYNNVDSEANTCIFSVAAEENLGGNPRVFAADALKLGYGCIFTPTADMTIDDANRGVTFAASTNTASVVRTGPTLDLAYDFTIDTPVAFEAGAFTKTNSGTFAWGKGGTTVAVGVSLAVQDGAIKPQGFDALGSMALSFSNGAALAFDVPLAAGDSRSTHGVDMRTVALTKAGDKLPVRLVLDTAIIDDAFSAAMVPLATFTDANAAQSFVDSVNFSAPRGYGVTLMVVMQTLDSLPVATVKAQIAKLGMRIIIR